MTARLHGWIALTEAYTAGGYTVQAWRRWWGNYHTGDVLAIALRDGDHDAYLFDYMARFFSPDTLEALPAPEDHTGYATDADDPIQSAQDKILHAAYAAGWVAVEYDGNTGNLSLRAPMFALTGIRKIVATIARSAMIVTLNIDFDHHSYLLNAQEICVLLKTGRLPRPC